MSIDWKLVTSGHVTEACRRFDAGEVKCPRPALNTFLILGGKHYPAKFIRGLAYEVATGRKLNPTVDFSGGAETERFFRKLGFQIKRPASAVRNLARRHRAVCPSLTAASRKRIKQVHLDEKQQKEALKEVLEREFEIVQLDQGFDWLVVPQEASMDEAVARIRQKLVRYRGFHQFYTSGLKLRCDFCVPNCRLIVEYDERQHFTVPSALCLEEYCQDLSLGFSRAKWLEACRATSARDNEPPHRDEQRAFYDTLRDYLAARNGFTLVRIKHGDWDWNEPGSGQHVREMIQRFTGNVVPPCEDQERTWDINIRSDPKPSLGRIIIKSTWPGDVLTAQRLLEEVTTAWPEELKVDFLVTCGAFLRFEWPESLSAVHDYLTPEPEAVDTLLRNAEHACDSLLKRDLVARLAQRVRYLTIGVDSPPNNKITTTRNCIAVPHVELVCVVDVHAQPLRYYWTGKSYPTNAQAKTLVRIADLKTHFLDLELGSVMLLGCHDLTMFNPRARANAQGWRKRTEIQFQTVAKRKCPSIVLHHPHTTVKTRTWFSSWRQLGRDLPSVAAFVGAGRYQEDDRTAGSWDGLRAVLDSTRLGPTVDVICSLHGAR